MDLRALLKKHNLEELNDEDVKREENDLKLREEKRMQHIASLQEQVDDIRIYARQESLAETEEKRCAEQAEGIEADIAAAEREVGMLRRQRRMLGGLVVLKRHIEQLDDSNLMKVIGGMDSAKLEEGLTKLDGLGDQVIDNVGHLCEVMGISADGSPPRKEQILEEIRSGRDGHYDQA